MTQKSAVILDASVSDGVVEFIDTTSVRLEGNLRENMTFKDGLSYLRSYQDGTLHHPDMENLNYLFIRENGDLAYLDFRKQEVEIVWDLNEFAEGNDWSPTWYYMPGSELTIIKDGIETLQKARIQEPVNPVDHLPVPK